MARYKPQDRNGRLLSVVLCEQIVSGSFAFALDYLVDHELDLSELAARFRNDEVGASTYDPSVMLKIMLLFAYSQGMVSSRAVAKVCIHNVQFSALSGNSQSSHAHIAKFVNSLGEQVKPLFTQVLMTCDAQGLIGGDLFAIDASSCPAMPARSAAAPWVSCASALGAWSVRPTRSLRCIRARTTARWTRRSTSGARPASTPAPRGGAHTRVHCQGTQADQPQGPGDQNQRHRSGQRQDGHRQGRDPGLCSAGRGRCLSPGDRRRGCRGLGL